MSRYLRISSIKLKLAQNVGLEMILYTPISVETIWNAATKSKFFNGSDMIETYVSFISGHSSSADSSPSSTSSDT